MAIEEFNLGYWGKEMAWDEFWWREWCLPLILQQLQHLDGPTSIFRAYYIIFLKLLEAHDFLRETQFHSLKIILFLLCHGDTQRELVNTPWTHHVLHLFFAEWDSLSQGDLVHFYIILLYWSMYYMVSSSQPLMRTFVSVNLSHSFEKWLGFWFSRSYLKERASHL